MDTYVINWEILAYLQDQARNLSGVTLHQPHLSEAELSRAYTDAITQSQALAPLNPEVYQRSWVFLRLLLSMISVRTSSHLDKLVSHCTALSWKLEGGALAAQATGLDSLLELHIAQKLDWNLHVPTVADFQTKLLEPFNNKDLAQTIAIANEITRHCYCQGSVLTDGLMETALASLLLALDQLKLQTIKHQLLLQCQSEFPAAAESAVALASQLKAKHN